MLFFFKSKLLKECVLCEIQKNSVFYTFLYNITMTRMSTICIFKHKTIYFLFCLKSMLLVYFNKTSLCLKYCVIMQAQFSLISKCVCREKY